MKIFNYLKDTVFNGDLGEITKTLNYNFYTPNENSLLYDCTAAQLNVKLAILLNVYRPTILAAEKWSLHNDFFIVNDKTAYSFQGIPPNNDWLFHYLDIGTSQLYLRDVCTHYYKYKDLRLYSLKLFDSHIYESPYFLVYFERLLKETVYLRSI